MKSLFYGVAVSALMLGAGGAAVACEQHAKSAALQNPAAATHAFTPRGFTLAQMQQEEQSGTTGQGSSEEPKPEDAHALPHRAIGPLAQSQDDADKEKAEEEKKPEAVPSRGFTLAQQQDEADKEKAEEEKKPEAVPSHTRGFVLAQMQDDDKEKSTTGEDTKPEGDDQK